MIDLTVDRERQKRNIQRIRERNIIIPTFAQMRDPGRIPERIKADLSKIGLWDIVPRNLFRITWKNEPKPSGGGFGPVNYLEFPEQPDRGRGQDHGTDREVVPDRRGQGRGDLRLPGAAAGYRPVRSDHPEGSLAVHRQLLPRGRLQRPADGQRVHRHSAGGHEQGAF